MPPSASDRHFHGGLSAGLHLPAGALNTYPFLFPMCTRGCAPCRLEKAGWQKQQKALESQLDKGRRAAEEARGRLAEQENALKQLGLERRASQQER